MIAEPKCFTRGCKHFTGVYQSNDTEEGECPACKAFTEGIPDVIAYGDNPHTTPFPGDHGIQFEAESDGSST